jgi:hypothetical protein
MTAPDSRAVVAGVMDEHEMGSTFPSGLMRFNILCGCGERFRDITLDDHRAHVADAIVAALDAAGLLTVGEEREEWGVRDPNGTEQGPWTEDTARIDQRIRPTGDGPRGTLIRRTRTTYPDRVTEWKEA